MLWAELWSWKRRSCCWTGVGAARQRVISPRILGSGPSFAMVACRKEFSPCGRRVCVCVFVRGWFEWKHQDAVVVVVVVGKHITDRK